MLFLLGLTTSSINHEKAFILISFIRLFICNHCTEYDLCISRNDPGHQKGTSESPYGTIEEARNKDLILPATIRFISASNPVFIH